MVCKKAQCVVIKVNDYGESDKLITVYCPEAGKLQVLAKGAKRSQKRFVNKLELFSRLTIQYNDKYNLPILTEAELDESYLQLRLHFMLYACAALICEHIYYWTTENDGDEELFNCLLWSLDSLSKTSHPLKPLVLFLSKLYGLLGYQPSLHGCAACQQLDPQSVPFGFRTGQGNIICKHCCKEERPAIPLSIATIKMLSKAFELPVHKLSRLKLSTECSHEALNLFHHYGRYLLDRDFQSWKYLL